MKLANQRRHTKHASLGTITAKDYKNLCTRERGKRERGRTLVHMKETEEKMSENVFQRGGV